MINYRETSVALDSIRLQLQEDPLSPALLVLEREALASHSQATISYEKFVHQKSKVNWLRLGDSGSGYFHAIMKSRGTKNRILPHMDNGFREITLKK